MTRAERVEQARKLRATETTLPEIATALGVSIHTVRSYFTDPDLSKLRARKANYSGECVDCGQPTDGTNGRDKAAIRCSLCAAVHQRRAARWTRSSIIAAHRSWFELTGRVARASDWRTRRRMAELGVENPDDWPLTSTVQEVFVKWNASIAAADLPTLQPGQYPRDRVASGLAGTFAG